MGLAQVLQDGGVRGVAGLRPLAGREPQLGEEDVLELLGAAERELVADRREDPLLEPRDLGREVGRERRQPRAVDRDAGRLQVGEDGDERQLELREQPGELGLIAQRLTKRVTGAIGRWIGEGNIVAKKPVMGAEDFGLFGRTEPKIPICMFWLGTITKESVTESIKTGKTLPSLHSSKFAPVPEPTLKTGVTAMSLRSIRAATVFGSTRGTFSVRPPPVM